MVEHAVHDSDAVAKIRLEQRHEGASVPCRERRDAKAAGMVISDAVLVEARPVFLVIEVVRLGHLGEKAPPVSSERPTGQKLLHRRVEPRRRVRRDATEDNFAPLAEIGAKQRQQLDHDLRRDFTGDFMAVPTRSAPRIPPLDKETTMALPELLLLFNLFSRARSPRGGSGFALLPQTTVRLIAGCQ